MRTLLLMLTLLCSTQLFAHGTIIINNVTYSKGYIDVKIYDNKDSFLNEKLATEIVRKKATQGKTVVPLSTIHEGQIAIVVYHDEDGNGKMKTGLFWRPKEGFAFSNDYKPKGPPKFSKTAITLIHGETVEIQLNY